MQCINFPTFAFPVVPNGSDEAIIRKCVELARRAAGQTRPNPPVGCVLTDTVGRTLGEGYHRKAGTPHAEVHALSDARRRGHNPKGATAYVSLEPCNHYGRTPPCAKALVEAGVARVVVGMQDPDPRTRGGGIARLKAHGIAVDVGVEEQLCRELCEGFVSRVEKRRPFGILKWAMTLDGKIATESGSSRWVTGDEARKRVHTLRSTVDAIVVGGLTVRRDDPRLTVRGIKRDGDLSPLRVVMTRTLDLPFECALWNVSEAETIVFSSSTNGNDDLAKHLQARGVHVYIIPDLTPLHVMDYLYDRGCLNVLWECGGALASHAIQAGAVQKILAFIAPKLVGGTNAPSPIGSPALIDDMSKAVVLRNRSLETFNNGDFLISGYL